MGFTLASIDPSMCAIIFAPKTFKDEWRTEVDPFAERIGDPDNLIESCSDGKVYTHLDLTVRPLMGLILFRFSPGMV